MEVKGEEIARRQSFVSSPEFEFNSVAVSQTQLISADELFVDGILLPLRLLFPKIQNQNKVLATATSDTPPTTNYSVPVFSKRWTDMFRMGSVEKEKDGSKKKTKTKGMGMGMAKKKKNLAGAVPTRASSAEQLNININIWPFARSRSVKNNKSKSEILLIRKVNSAPCSRSNSDGGINTGHQSQVKQNGSKNKTNGRTHNHQKKNAGSKFLKLNVNSCRDQNGMTAIASCPKDIGSCSSIGGHHFNLKSFFFPKV
ncbi:hypothetical protein ZOSMA_7G01550 [Zostera marina]|uniref:Uncharacterized protein n=1 Tax=Zostera marina TaxID=29655 RepID=A0A0K9NMY6_ZOSMR|nr:hypothetical protein ZOSMA_7G01550 [Zostera marina]